jgi:2-keto-4-pentenoate hydratase/2-oxohepta-3-ene-1,7-dioic acid hydratase in catechol pathway
MTGTCEGVSRVNPGDTMHCDIEGIGEMDVAVR